MPRPKPPSVWVMVARWLCWIAVIFVTLAFFLLVALAVVNEVQAGERPEIPPLHEAEEVRPTPSGLTILVFHVEARDLEAAFQTVPSEPEPVCDRVVLIERRGHYLARRDGRACVYRIVPEPVMWRWPAPGVPFESWVGHTWPVEGR